MDDERVAIFEALKAIRDQKSVLPDRYNPDYKLELDASYILKALIDGSEKVRPGARFRALRFLLSRFGRQGFYMLQQMVLAQSSSTYRLILRERKQSERPGDGRAQREFEKQDRTYHLAKRIYRLIDRTGISLDTAIAHVLDRTNATFQVDSFKQNLKEFRRAAKERGYTDHSALFDEWLFGTKFLYQISTPHLPLERITRKGRPPKNKE